MWLALLRKDDLKNRFLSHKGGLQDAHEQHHTSSLVSAMHRGIHRAPTRHHCIIKWRPFLRETRCFYVLPSHRSFFFHLLIRSRGGQWWEKGTVPSPNRFPCRAVGVPSGPIHHHPASLADGGVFLRLQSFSLKNGVVFEVAQNRHTIIPPPPPPAPSPSLGIAPTNRLKEAPKWSFKWPEKG